MSLALVLFAGIFDGKFLLSISTWSMALSICLIACNRDTFIASSSDFFGLIALMTTPASIPMIAMAIRSSMRVNPSRLTMPAITVLFSLFCQGSWQIFSVYIRIKNSADSPSIVSYLSSLFHSFTPKRATRIRATYFPSTFSFSSARFFMTSSGFVVMIWCSLGLATTWIATCVLLAKRSPCPTPELRSRYFSPSVR